MKLQLIELVTLALFSASNAQHGSTVRGASLENDSSSLGSGVVPWNVKATEEEANECNTECQTDSDCHQGGIITCGECNFVYGARYDKACVRPSAPSTPAPTPFNYFPDEYAMCKASCRHDRDCEGQGGVYNPCYSCGQYSGTLMHHKCYQVQPVPPPTPAPEHNYFPDAGKCSKSCTKDSDCKQRAKAVKKHGLNPCMKCGQYSGTIMHHKCFSPDEAVAK